MKNAETLERDTSRKTERPSFSLILVKYVTNLGRHNQEIALNVSFIFVYDRKTLMTKQRRSTKC